MKDGSEIYIETTSKNVTYIDVNGELETFEVKEKLARLTSGEVHERMVFVKEALRDSQLITMPLDINSRNTNSTGDIRSKLTAFSMSCKYKIISSNSDPFPLSQFSGVRGSIQSPE